MKTKLTLIGIAASIGAAASLNAQTAVTAAVGYHTESLITGFNMIGVNVGNAVAAAGDFESAGTDTDVDFTALLTAGTSYTVQNIDTGDYATVDSFTATALTTTPALAATAGDKYEIRQDQTIADLFGAANEAGLMEGSDQTADVIWVPRGDGTYTRIFRNNVSNIFPPLNPGWRSIGGGDTDFGAEVVPFQFGMFVEVRGGALDLVFVGHVRGDDPDDLNGHGAAVTNIPVVTGFNALNRIVPVEITVADAGAATFLTPGDADTSDVLWNPVGDGTYTRIYNNNTSVIFPPLNPGLRAIGGGDVDASGELMQSGYIVERRAGAGVAGIMVPSVLDL